MSFVLSLGYEVVNLRPNATHEAGCRGYVAAGVLGVRGGGAQQFLLRAAVLMGGSVKAIHNNYIDFHQLEFI